MATHNQSNLYIVNVSSGLKMEQTKSNQMFSLNGEIIQADEYKDNGTTILVVHKKVPVETVEIKNPVPQSS